MSINPWPILAAIGLLVLAIVFALTGLTELALFAMVGTFLAVGQTIDSMSSKPKRRRDRWPNGDGGGGSSGCSGGSSGCSGGSSGGCGGGGGGCGGG